MLKRKTELASSLGMTLAEYNNRKVVEKKEKKAAIANASKGLTEEGRKRISESLKKRWQDPAYREKISGD